jgi:hypothetical protein
MTQGFASLLSLWRANGIDPEYHVFAAVLQSNRVSPHQVPLDDDVGASATPTPGPPSLELLPTSPRTSPPTTTPRDFLSLCLTVGSVQGFSFGGFSAWRDVVTFLYFSLLFCLSGLDQLLFATRWYDLEVSYDAYPQDANLTLVGKIFFP